MTKFRCNLCFAGTDLFCEFSIPDKWDGGIGDCPKWGSAEWKKVEENQL